MSIQIDALEDFGKNYGFGELWKTQMSNSRMSFEQLLAGNRCWQTTWQLLKSWPPVGSDGEMLPTYRWQHLGKIGFPFLVYQQHENWQELLNTVFSIFGLQNYRLICISSLMCKVYCGWTASLWGQDILKRAKSLKGTILLLLKTSLNKSFLRYNQLVWQYIFFISLIFLCISTLLMVF